MNMYISLSCLFFSLSSRSFFLPSPFSFFFSIDNLSITDIFSVLREPNFAVDGDELPVGGIAAGGNAHGPRRHRLRRVPDPGGR